MAPLKKIYITAAIWAGLTGLVLGVVVPKQQKGLVTLQESNADQIDKLKDLREQVKTLQKIQEDLAKVEQQEVKPNDFFTGDTRLVNEIKTIELFALKSNLLETLTISGTADKATAVQSLSGLAQIPYSISLQGSFPNVVKFIKYLENAYFISPVNALSVTYSEQGSVKATVLTNFYLYK